MAAEPAAVVVLRLQPSLLAELRKVAEAEGVSVNRFITVAVAEKLSARRTEDDFRERAARADRPRARAIPSGAGGRRQPAGAGGRAAARGEG